VADGVISAQGRRFGLAYLALAAVLGAAIDDEQVVSPDAPALARLLPPGDVHRPTLLHA
jgi:hypothetical protein